MGFIPVTTVDETGVHVPAIESVLAALQARFRAIHGSDVVLDPDTQDGEWLGELAAAFNDANGVGLAVYNQFSPSTAVGVGLSSVVKVNGIARKAATQSTVDLLCVGVYGTKVTSPSVRDQDGNVWNLDDFVIPLSGQVVVSAECSVLGDVQAPAGSLWNIVTYTLGWQAATNGVDATPGAPVETDPQLRVRQSRSTMNPSQSILDGIVGAVLALDNVATAEGYENDTQVPDELGIPGNCVSLVVDGGDSAEIAETIAIKKAHGCSTYGTTTVTVLEKSGRPKDVSFFRPVGVVVTFVVSVTPLANYTSDTATSIRQALADYVNSLGVGAGGDYFINLERAKSAALLSGSILGKTFLISSLSAARGGAVPSSSDVPVKFNERPTCDPSNNQVLTP